MTVVRICACGEDCEPGRDRCADCTPQRDRSNDKPPKHKHLHTARWTNISKRLRKASPFCEICQAATDLVVDHVVPISVRPEWAYEIANLRVLCRSHNASKRASYDPADEQRIADAIAARKGRPSAM